MPDRGESTVIAEPVDVGHGAPEPLVPGARARVFHVITKLELGGAQKVTLMSLDRLPESRYELGLVSGPEGLLRGEAENIRGLRHFWIPSLVRELRPVRDLQSLVSMYRVFRKEQPDIVHTHSSKAGVLGRWAAWLASVPIIFHTAHGFGFNDYQGRLAQSFYVWIERVTGLITTQAVVVSRANATRAERLGLLEPGEWILCRDSIAVSEFTREGPGSGTSRNPWDIPRDRTIVGMVACFKPQKCPLDFIEVARLVLDVRKDVHFVVAGDGDLRGEIEALIRRHQIDDHVTLLGWQRNMPEVYHNLDIFVLTSLWEGQPCVYAEAMASGLPIVATDVDGAREAILDETTGFIHPRRDVQGLAHSVLRLIADPDLRYAMGRDGLSRVEEFDIDRSVATLDHSYQQHLAVLRARSSDV